MIPSKNRKTFHRTEHDAANAFLFQVEKGLEGRLMEIRLTGADAQALADAISQMQDKILVLQKQLINAQQQLIEAQKQALDFAKEQKISISLNGGSF